jgi:hypothetical protein
MNEKITVVTNWDGGNYYQPEYINRLYRACCRNISRPFDFVLHAGPLAARPGRLDAIDPHIRVVQVGLPSWWSSMAAFQKHPPGIHTAGLLFLDLDIVVVGSLDDLIDYPSELALMKDYPAAHCPPGREKDGNTGITLIRNGAGEKIWSEYIRHGMPIWDAATPPPHRPLPLATMTIINDPANGIAKTLFPENWVASYKLQVRDGGLPADCRIVHFHGRPKPHQVDEPFVKEHWI